MPASGTEAVAAVPEQVPVPVSAHEKKMQVDSLLVGIFSRMGYPARLEFKDMADGGLGVAVHFDSELPGISGNKRTYLVDCIQFLVNKVVNRPNVEKRWVTLGVGGFPEPRGQKPEPSAPRASRPVRAAPPPQGARASAPQQPAAGRNAGTPSTGVASAQPQAKKTHEPKPPQQAQQQGRGRSNEHDERSMKVDPRPVMTRLGTALAEKAAKHGRFYGVTLLPVDDRARLIAAAANTKGVTVKTEGEGYFRRVVFVPEKPTVITKKQVMPDYDDEE